MHVHFIHTPIFTALRPASFLPHKKAFNENPAASTSTLHAERVSSTYIIRFILKQNVFVVFCECTRNIYTHTPCIIDIRNVFEEALAIQNSTTILLAYNIGECVGNPENLIIDHVNYENLHQSLQIDVLAKQLLLRGYKHTMVVGKQICGMLNARKRLRTYIHKINDFVPISFVHPNLPHKIDIPFSLSIVNQVVNIKTLQLYCKKCETFKRNGFFWVQLLIHPRYKE